MSITYYSSKGRGLEPVQTKGKRRKKIKRIKTGAGLKILN